MNHVIPGASLHHVALSVKKYEKSRDFYCRAFGMSCVNEWEFSGKRLCFLDVGDGNFLELHSNAGKMPPEVPQYLHFCIHTSDLEGAYANAVRHGAIPNREPFDFLIQSKPVPMPVRGAWLYGPDGEQIELFQHTLKD